MQIIPSASVNLAKLGSNPPPWGATHIFALTPALQINNARPCPVNVNLRKKMHLVSRGVATTPNISASGLYTRPYRLFMAVGGISKVCTMATIAMATIQPVSLSVRARIWRIHTHEGHAVCDADKRWIVCGGTDSGDTWNFRVTESRLPGTSTADLSKPHRAKTPAANENKAAHNSQCEFGNRSWQ